MEMDAGVCPLTAAVLCLRRRIWGGRDCDLTRDAPRINGSHPAAFSRSALSLPVAIAGAFAVRPTEHAPRHEQVELLSGLHPDARWQ